MIETCVQRVNTFLLGADDIVHPAHFGVECIVQLLQLLIFQLRLLKSLILHLVELTPVQTLQVFFLPLSLKLSLIELTSEIYFCVVQLSA
jgi:hypothetical protein